MENMTVKNNFKNLPQEIMTLKRFLPVRNDDGKKPISKSWNKTENQKFLFEINSANAAFFIGNGSTEDFCALDFDHVLDDNGEFVDTAAQDLYNNFRAIFPNAYCEKSVSGHGLHALLLPTENKFPAIKGKKIQFDNNICLEIFYKFNKTITLTGNLYNCAANAPIPKGEKADEFLSKLLDEIQKQNDLNKPQAQKTTARKISDNPTEYNIPPELNHDLAIMIFKAIGAEDFDNKDWLPCISNLVYAGVSDEEIRILNIKSAKYNERNFDEQLKWVKENSKTFNLGVLIKNAEEKNVDYKDFIKQWRKDHPATQLDSLKAELREVEKTLADYETEKNSAIEKLKKAEQFDKDSVFTDDFITAAAFAKISNRKVFSDIKAKIQRHISTNKTEKFMTEWNAEVRDKVDELTERTNELQSQKIALNAKITSTNFVSTTPELKDFVIPALYSVSKESGVQVVQGEQLKQVALRPIIIKSSFYDAETRITKLTLCYMNNSGKWKEIPAQSADVIFNAKKIVDLAKYKLPVTSAKANYLVEYLDAFNNDNEEKYKLTYTVSQCGWHEFDGEDYFIDPRLKCEITDDDRKVDVTVDDNNALSHSLKSVGSLEQWKIAYDLAKKSPVARLTVAAALAPPLLKILGERNFVFYTHGRTRGGKSTAMNLAASAVGKNDMVISFDGTNNGLLGMAAETADMPFFVDEKQSADKHLKDQFQRFIYNVANGKERARANKDGTIRQIREWRNITLANGETELLGDNATGGAYTRLLQLHAPDVILDAETCKKIREVTKNNYGLVFPKFIEQILKVGIENLKADFDSTVSIFEKSFSDTLSEYCRYLAILAIADTLLNMIFGSEKFSALYDSYEPIEEIAKMIPTLEEIDDTEREKDFLLGFITQNQKCFLGATKATVEQMPAVYGKFDDDFIYITVAAMEMACSADGFDRKKVVADLIKDNFIVPSDKIKSGRKNPLATVQKKISGGNTNCYRIVNTLKENYIG